jgi:hypothetical protein
MIRLFAYSPVFQIKEQNNQHQPASLAENIIQPEQPLDRGILQGFFEFAGNRCFYWQMSGRAGPAHCPSPHAEIRNSWQMTDAVVSVFCRTKPDNNIQTTVTNEVRTYFVSRECGVVILPEESAENGWSLKVLVRIPPNQPTLKSMRRTINALVNHPRLGSNPEPRAVHIVQCNGSQSHVLDQSLPGQDRAVKATPCGVTPGPAASGCTEMRFQPQLASKPEKDTILHPEGTGTGMHGAHGLSHSDPHSATFLDSILSQTTWLGRRVAAEQTSHAPGSEKQLLQNSRLYFTCVYSEESVRRPLIKTLQSKHL